MTLVSMILSSVVAHASCPSFAAMDQVYQDFGYNVVSRLAVKCLTEMKISEEEVAGYYQKIHGLRAVMQDRINNITLRKDEISKECNRACAFDRKANEALRRLLVDNFANTYLPPPSKSQFLECFGVAVRSVAPSKAVR